MIACGSCGVLDGSLPMGHVIVPTEAIRDEGTSYHYLAPGTPALPNSACLTAIETTLQRHHVPYQKTKTWTTDAFFRETRGKIKHRREQGCGCVEMEAAAFFAVASFRGIRLGQMLYGGDDVSGDSWDNRNWIDGAWSTRERLLQLAVEACLAVAVAD